MAKKIIQTDIPENTEVNDSDEYHEEEIISKSKRKRDAEAAQQLGKNILALSHDDQKNIDLPENLSNALDDARRIKKNSALKRQLQYIGKLMLKSSFQMKFYIFQVLYFL